MASKLRLSFVTARNERIAAALDGEIEVEGIDLVVTYSGPSETFWRQLKFNEFEAGELSNSSALIALSQGADYVLLPIYPSRSFFWLGQSYHVDSGVRTAEDVKGKRIGVSEYQQTSALWTRAILEHDFGVSQFDVEWWMERTEEFSHGGATHFQPMEGIKFQRIPVEKSLATMLANHELDVAPVTPGSGPRETNVIDRSATIRPQNADWSKVKPLFPDRIGEAKRFFDKYGYIPANHGYFIRGDIYRQHPWIAFNLYTAFSKAKQRYLERLPSMIPNGLLFGADYLRQTRQMFGDDPWPFGVKANRKMLEDTIQYSYEQGFIPSKPKVEELFPEILRDL
jgi:4,5-dihydroxyphthalate decarboxylase